MNPEHSVPQVAAVTKAEAVSSISFELHSSLDAAPASSEPVSVAEGEGTAGVDQSWPFSREVDAALEEVRSPGHVTQCLQSVFRDCFLGRGGQNKTKSSCTRTAAVLALAFLSRL